jgi:hypothetical protein
MFKDKNVKLIKTLMTLEKKPLINLLNMVIEATEG